LCRKVRVNLQAMIRRLSKFIATFAIVLILLPIAAGTALTYSKGWPTSWRSADWSSSGLLPAATATDEAVVYVMAARSGRWKGIFAVHHWLVLKPQGPPGTSATMWSAGAVRCARTTTRRMGAGTLRNRRSFTRCEASRLKH
jgi:hypothetical protein